MIPDELDTRMARPRYLTQESRVVRLLCVITVVCVVVSLPLLKNSVAFFVSLRLRHPVFCWGHAVAPRSVLAAVCLCVVPAVWLLWVEMERRLKARLFTRVPVAAFVAVVLTAACCILFQQTRIRWVFLEAVKVRSEQFSFMRSIVFWQRDAMDYVASEGVTNVVLVGSSQMNFAVDADLLASGLPQTRVHKRCLPGFGIMQYLMVAPDLIKLKPGIVVCWISEFDAFRDDRVPVNRLRYFSRLRQMLHLAQALRLREAWQNRSELADLTMAAFVPLWRDRDLCRRLASDFWWHAPMPAEASAGLNKAVVTRQRENLRKSVRRTELLDANCRSLLFFARRIASENMRLCVFEGSTSPVVTSVYDPSFRTETRERLRRIASEAGFEYVDETGMPGFKVQDFSDLYHLTPSARERFTKFLAQYIRGQVGK